MNRIGATQLTFTFRTLLGQDMSAERVVALETAGSGFLETFRRAPVGLQLWHRDLRFSLSKLQFFLLGFLLLGRQHHNHLSSFHLWKLLHGSVFLKVCFYLFQKIHTKLLVA